MTTRQRSGWAFVCTALLLAGCNAERTAPTCTPGDIKECPCGGGGKGAQTCADDGGSWGECRGCTTKQDVAVVDAGKDAGTVIDVLPTDSPRLDVTVDLPQPDIKFTKKPTIMQIIPNNGFANGGKTGSGTPVIFMGSYFNKPVTVYIDGKPQATYPVVNSSVSISFLMPPNPGGKTKAQLVSVMLYMAGMFSNAVDFQYTVAKSMDSKFKGSVLVKMVNAYADFASPPINGRVLVLGVTDTSSGVSKKIKAEIGYGTVGKDPTQELGFMWSPATFVKQDGKYHIYTSALKVPLAQTYDVAYRFSHDSSGMGIFGTFVYADTDESDLKYDTASAARIKATSAPMGYCHSIADCVTQGLNQTCKVNTSDNKLNRCVQCLLPTDCAKFKYALGPHCKSEKCYCKSDADCAKNPNGFLCTSTKLVDHCGCNKDANCPIGTKCYKPGFCQ